jgi:hypothetical protein
MSEEKAWGKNFPHADIPDEMDEYDGLVSDFEFVVRGIQSRRIEDLVSAFSELDEQSQIRIMRAFRSDEYLRLDDDQT